MISKMTINMYLPVVRFDESAPVSHSKKILNKGSLSSGSWGWDSESEWIIGFENTCISMKTR